MQSRRHDEFMTGSPTHRGNSRKHRYELGPDQFLVSRRNAHAGDRSPPPRLGTGRSLSPPQRGIDGSKRVLVAEQRSGSIERRGGFGFHMSRGGGGGGGSGSGRTDRARSPSPPFGQLQKQPHYDEEVVHRKYSLSGHLGYDVNDNSRSKQGYGYDHGASTMSKEKYHDGNRIADINANGMVAQRTMAMEDGEVRESYRLSPDIYPNSNYGETGGHFQLSPRSKDMNQFPEKSRYLEPMPMDKLPVMEHYKTDKPMLHLQDDPYTMPPPSQFKDLANSSSGIARGEVMGVHRDDVRSWHSHDFSSRGKDRELIGFDAYEQSSNIDCVDPDVRRHNLSSYRRCAFSPTRVEHEDYFYPNSRGTTNDDHGYTSGIIHREMIPRAQLDYDHALMEYDQRDVSRLTVTRPVLGRGETSNDSGGNLRKSRMWDHHSLKSTVPDYLDMNRASNASKQRDEYLGSGSTHVDNGRRMPRDHEILPKTISHDRQITYLRPDEGFGRDDNSGNQKERSLEVSPRSRYEAEMHRLAVRRHRMQEEELGIYEPVNRVLKRKYPIEDDMRSHDSKNIISSKWNAHRDYEDLRDCEEDWTHEDMRGIYPSRPVRYDSDDYGKTERTYDGHRHHHIDYASDDLPPSRFSSGHTERHYVRAYKHSNGNRYIKGYTKPGSYGWHNSNNFNRKNVYNKQHKVWKNSDDVHGDERVNDGKPSEDWDNAVRPEQPEESEEFLKLVHEAFLKYYKRLNMNPAIRRRYLEQGKAGSLFCIVCGRSESKEFMDTQRLGTHAFMSHKIGLREEHLGLLKAICVVMGWSSVVPPDTITWVPQVLPDAEALAQKEDLILWPPLVIIHNVSLLHRNSGEKKIVNADKLEAFLRGKGFVGGKIKVCQGSQGDESIMVVKFLGTFTGLENAEKLHKYFAENKHGRVDVEQLSSRGGGGDLKGDEVVLYGYMGIVEDLDKLDYNTKKMSLIESKNGIQDLANAPVKQEKR